MLLVFSRERTDPLCSQRVQALLSTSLGAFLPLYLFSRTPPPRLNLSLLFLSSIQPDHGLYQISIDGIDSGTQYNGSSKAGFVQQLLFFGSGYEKNSQHTLVITDADGTKLDVDYAVVLGATR